MKRLLKHLLPGIVILSLLLALFPLAVAGDNGVTVRVEVGSPGTDEVEEGSNFTARVTITQVTNLDSFQFQVIYDPNIIEVIGVEGGAEGVTNGLIDSTDVPIDMWGFIPPGTPGTIEVLGNLPGLLGISGEGYLCEIHFRVIGTHCHSSDIDLYKGNGGLWNNGNPPSEIAADWVDDRVHVAGEPGGLDADFTAMPTAGETPLTVRFTDKTTGGQEPYDYEWNFGDGAKSTLENPTHTYVIPGTYTVKLKVTDAIDDTNTETKWHYIKATQVKKDGKAVLLPSNLLVSPEQVRPNQQVEISVNIANTGDANGNYQAVLSINGYVEDSTAISVPAGSSNNVVFRVMKSEPGTYEVSVAGLQGVFYVVAPDETSFFAGGGLGTGGIIAIVVVAIVLIVAIVFGVLRRQA